MRVCVALLYASVGVVTFTVVHDPPPFDEYSQRAITPTYPFNVSVTFVAGQTVTAGLPFTVTAPPTEAGFTVNAAEVEFTTEHPVITALYVRDCVALA